MGKEKYFFDKVKKMDDCIIKALNNDIYLKNNYKDLHSNDDFLNNTIEKYKNILQKANEERNIFKRWMAKESLMALHNIKNYKKILNNPLIKKAISANNSFENKIPELLNFANEKLKTKIEQMFGVNRMSYNISVILNNSKRYIHSKKFEKREELIEKENTSAVIEVIPTVLKKIKHKIRL